MRKKRKQARNRRRGLTALVVVLMILALAAILVWKAFVVKTVDVVGNEIYEDKKIEKWVLNDEYSWNSLYVFFKYKFITMDEIPFVDSIEVSLKSPSELEVKVIEKGVLGYLYVPTLDQNVYFDKDGFVVEVSEDVIEGTTKISGLVPEEVKLYEKLEIENSAVLKTLLSVTQLLKKYERMPSVILVDDYSLVLCYDNIQVNLGTGTNLSEKVLRMDQILPQLEGKYGTLHLETWTEDNTDVYFKIGELADIPADVAAVPDAKEEAASKEDATAKEEKDASEAEAAKDSKDASEDKSDNDTEDTSEEEPTEDTEDTSEPEPAEGESP